ncbi:MAG: MASE1 domain-containing protein [Parachlamydiaceae bacterium]|nr:MASE1 domain-containing protein [Parachlamydiaceae bacterium]
MVKKLPLIFQIVILTIVYLISSKIGQMLAIPPGLVTALWPPSGIALASLLLLGDRVWPAIWLGSFIGNFMILFPSANFSPTFEAGFVIACGSTLEGLVGAYGFNRIIGGNNPIQNTYSVFIFIFFSALLASLISSTIGSTSLLVSGFVLPNDYWTTWLTWWLGDSVGIITVTPTIVAMALCSQEDLAPKKILEFVILMIPLSLISFWLIANYNQLAFMLIPFVLWAIFRLGSLWSPLISLFISSVAISYIFKGIYLFGGTSVNQSTLLLQSFIAVVFVIDMFLSSLLNERKRAHDALQKSKTELEMKVDERTKALSHTLRDLKNKEAQLLQTEKMSSLKILTAGIAHQINNPLNFVLTSIYPLVRNYHDVLSVLKKYLEINPDNKTIKKDLEEINSLKVKLQLDTAIKEIPQLLLVIKNGAERTAEIVKDFRMFSRLDESEKKQANVEEGLDATLALLTCHYETKAAIKKEYGKIRLIDCFPGELNQVFLIILSNAFDAVKDCAHAEITITTWEPNEKQVGISIQDNGQGMTSEIKKQVFDPFFTTKDIGKGVGLGLTIADRIIKEHGGIIDIESEVGKGSKFTIMLPIG